MAVMDGSIVNLALPGIARELNAPASQAIWVVNAYQIASLVMLLPLAALGDRLGYRRVYLVGMALFVLSSVLAMLADSLLDAHRSARTARPGRRRHHEREHRAGAADLPQRAAGARHGDQFDGGGHLGHGRAGGGGGHPVGGLLALAVRAECAAGSAHACGWAAAPCPPTRRARGRAAVLVGRRAAQRPDVHAGVHRRRAAGRARRRGPAAPRRWAGPCWPPGWRWVWCTCAGSGIWQRRCSRWTCCAFPCLRLSMASSLGAFCAQMLAFISPAVPAAGGAGPQPHGGRPAA